MLKRAGRLIQLPLKLIPIIVFGILLTAVVNIVITTVNYNEVKEDLKRTQVSNTKEIWEDIATVVEQGYNDNKLVTSSVALSIENQLLRKYPNLDDLKAEFESDNLGDKFHTTVKGVIDKNEFHVNETPYLTLVGTREKLLLASANNENNILRHIDTQSLLTWDGVAELTPDKELSLSALDSVFTKTNKVIFTQTDNSHVDNIYGSDADMDTLHNVFDRHGLSGLYDFSILASGFITNSGDIFGTDDRYYLSKNDNHKIIVLQVISLSSILEPHKEKIALQIENNILEENDIERYMIQQLLTTVTISLMLFILSLILIAVHNAEQDRNRRGCCNADSKKGE